MCQICERFDRPFYRRDPVTLARALLGQRLVRVLDGQRLAGRIVEVEAYLGLPDRAAHTYNGRHTPRNASMWGDAGHAYVYFTYGLHHCVNVVAGRQAEPVAVLIRALEPEQGLAQMHLHRAGKPSTHPTPRKRDTDLCSGPAKLCQALAIDRHLDSVDLVRSQSLFIEKTNPRPLTTRQVTARPRVGVTYAGAWARKPLRFYITANPHVSRV